MEVEAPLPLPLPPPPSSLTTTSSEALASPPAHAIANCTECRRLCIVLLDGSARTRLYRSTLTDVILPAIFRLGSGGGGRSDPSSTVATHYVILAYGDYPPASPAPVLTIYTGPQASEAQAAIRAWPFHGGAPIRNALHEGLAAALECADRVRGWTEGRETAWTQGALLVILSCSMIYEDFHAHALARFHYGALGAEELVRELQRRSVAIQYYCPLLSLAGTFVGILERAYQSREGGASGEVVDRQIPGLPPSWVVRIALPEGMARAAAIPGPPSLFLSLSASASASASSSSSSSSFSSAAVVGADEAVPPTASAAPPPTATQTALEAAVRQFLGSVLKMPLGQRAEAIKQHLESPAYSAEYKQCLLTMVKQMQQSASSSSSSAVAGASLPPRPFPAPSSKGHGNGDGSLGSASSLSPLTPTRPSSTSVIASSRPAIWTGRLAFKHSNIESYFDLAACPIANPKGSLPHSIPPVAEYHVEAWPLVLAISSFVSIQSAAVVASVPISRLVELVPWAKESATATANADIAGGFRSMLYAKQLVGLVRLGGGQQAMLIAARPHQLVGMVISRQEAVRDGSIVSGVAGGMSATSHASSPSSASCAPGGGGGSAVRPLPRYNLRSGTPAANAGRSTGGGSPSAGATGDMGTVLPGTRAAPASGSSPRGPVPQAYHMGMAGQQTQAPSQVPAPATDTAGYPSSLILTPEEILRQHRPGTASVPASAGSTVSPTAATFVERPVAMEDVFTALSANDSIGTFDQLTMGDLTNSPTKPRAGSQDPLFFDGPY